MLPAPLKKRLGLSSEVINNNVKHHIALLDLKVTPFALLVVQLVSS